jgi:hypothetical protein
MAMTAQANESLSPAGKGEGEVLLGLERIGGPMRIVTAMIVVLSVGGLVWAENSFDQRYERDYNIFHPMNESRLDNPANPINRGDLRNPVNPINRFNLDNPLNPINQSRPDNPLNPINRENPRTPFRAVEGGGERGRAR